MEVDGAIDEMENKHEQELHDLRRLLNAACATKKYLEEDVEVLERQVKNNEEKKEDLVKKLNEEHNDAVSEWKGKVEHLEEILHTERNNYRKEIEDLKLQLVELRKDTTESATPVASVAELETLRNVNNVLKDKLENIQSKMIDLAIENGELKRMNEELLSEKEELQNILKCKQEDLASCTDSLNELRDLYASLKNEYDMLKTAPANSGRGNSVFAEVDDNRKALKANLDALSKKYKSKAVELARLKSERNTLIEKMHEVTKSVVKHENELIESYKDRVKDLQDTVEHLQKNNQDVSQETDFKVMDSLFSSKRREIESLKEQLEKQSQITLIQSENIFSLQRNLQVAEARFACVLAEKNTLQGQLEDLHIDSAQHGTPV